MEKFKRREVVSLYMGFSMMCIPSTSKIVKFIIKRIIKDGRFTGMYDIPNSMIVPSRLYARPVERLLLTAFGRFDTLVMLGEYKGQVFNNVDCRRIML